MSAAEFGGDLSGVWFNGKRLDDPAETIPMAEPPYLHAGCSEIRPSAPVPLHERVDYWIEEAEQALNMVAWLAENRGNAELQAKAETLEEKVRWLSMHNTGEEWVT